MNALHADALSRGLKGAIFVTLTFANRRDAVDPDGAIRNYVNALMMWCSRKWGFRPPYYWAAEPQGDGTLHYHLAVWVPRRHWRWHIPMPDRSHWPHGKSEVAWVRKSVIGYLAKYLGKYGTSKAGKDESRLKRSAFFAWARFRGFYPRTRTHGFGGVESRCRRALGRFRLPRYIRAFSAKYEGRAMRRPGGGWIVPGLPGADYVQSAYSIESCIGGFLYVRPSGLWDLSGKEAVPLPDALRVDGCPF
jgi:hypothetical protein